MQEAHMKVQPIGDRVLVKVEEGEEKSSGGIFIPQTAQEKTQVGVIEAIGDDDEVITVKKGQKIMYDKYAGTSVTIEGKEFLLVKMQDILAVIS